MCFSFRTNPPHFLPHLLQLPLIVTIVQSVYFLTPDVVFLLQKQLYDYNECQICFHSPSRFTTTETLCYFSLGACVNVSFARKPIHPDGSDVTTSFPAVCAYLHINGRVESCYTHAAFSCKSCWLIFVYFPFLVCITIKVTEALPFPPCVPPAFYRKMDLQPGRDLH